MYVACRYHRLVHCVYLHELPLAPPQKPDMAMFLCASRPTLSRLKQ